MWPRGGFGTTTAGIQMEAHPAPAALLGELLCSLNLLFQPSPRLREQPVAAAATAASPAPSKQGGPVARCSESSPWPGSLALGAAAE